MRAHGVPDFPDPVQGANGLVSLGGVGLISPQAQAAREACRSLALAGQVGPQTVSLAQQEAFLRWASCIRASGVPDFPDPSFSGEGPRFDIPGDANLGALQSAVGRLPSVTCPVSGPAGLRSEIKHRP